MKYIDKFDGLTDFVCVCVCVFVCVCVCVCFCVCVCVCVLQCKQEPDVVIELCNATSFANSYRGFGSLTFFSSSNKFYLWRTCIKSDSQLLTLTPLLQGFNSSRVCSVSINQSICTA
jgi:hypothetical protein